MVMEKTLESPLDCKEIKPVNPGGNQSWVFNRSTDAKAESPVLCLPDVKSWLTGKDPDAGRLKAGGEGDKRGWGGWMASLTQWTWILESSRRWWRTGKPGTLQFMGSQRVGHDWVTEEQLMHSHQVTGKFYDSQCWRVLVYDVSQKYTKSTQIFFKVPISLQNGGKQSYSELQPFPYKPLNFTLIMGIKSSPDISLSFRTLD